MTTDPAPDPWPTVAARLAGLLKRADIGHLFASPLQPDDEYGAPGNVEIGPYDLADRYGSRPDYTPELFNSYYESCIAIISGQNQDPESVAELFIEIVNAAPTLLAKVADLDALITEMRADHAENFAGKVVMTLEAFQAQSAHIAELEAQVRNAVEGAQPLWSGEVAALTQRAEEAEAKEAEKVLSAYENALSEWCDTHPAYPPSRDVRLDAMRAALSPAPPLQSERKRIARIIREVMGETFADDELELRCADAILSTPASPEEGDHAE